jgi:hypothetical protein
MDFLKILSLLLKRFLCWHNSLLHYKLSFLWSCGSNSLCVYFSVGWCTTRSGGYVPSSPGAAWDCEWGVGLCHIQQEETVINFAGVYTLVLVLPTLKRRKLIDKENNNNHCLFWQDTVTPSRSFVFLKRLGLWKLEKAGMSFLLCYAYKMCIWTIVVVNSTLVKTFTTTLMTRH